METDFDEAILRELKHVLESTRDPSLSVGAHLVIDRFKSLVDRYLDKKVLSHPELVDELPGLAKNLAKVKPESIAAVLEFILANCRACMFHNDACFLNLIFLAYKSAELGRLVSPNAVRPSMRVIHNL